MTYVQTEVINLVMETICGVYKIENMINHKVYIGQSVDIYTRWYNHKHDLRNGSHYNSHLQQSWNKYGEENFDFCIVEKCDEQFLDQLEISYIAFYKSYNGQFGYNLTLGGEGGIPNNETREKLSKANSGANNPMFGKRHAKDTKKKISEALSGINNPSYGKRGKNSPHYGKHLSDEQKAKLRAANSGKQMSDLAKVKQSQAKIGKNNPRATPVYCIELDETFDYIKEACEKYGVSKDGISKCIAGEQQSAGRHPLTKEKLHWTYADRCEVISL